MAFREVTMLEVKEVLRLWLLGVPKKRIAKQLGFDVKTVRRYLAAARAHGADAGHGIGALDDALVAAVVKVTQPETGRPRGEGWAVCETHREFIAGHLANRVRLSKVGKLLRRRGVDVGYDTVRRYAVEQLGFGVGARSVPVADGEPGEELQLDTGWMILLEPDLLGRRRRFKAWIFTAVLSRHRFVYPCSTRRPRRPSRRARRPGSSSAACSTSSSRTTPRPSSRRRTRSRRGSPTPSSSTPRHAASASTPRGCATRRTRPASSEPCRPSATTASAGSSCAPSTRRAITAVAGAWRTTG